MMPKRFVVALCLTLAAGFAPQAPRRPLARTFVQLQAERTSLGGMMFGDLIDGAKSLAKGMGVDIPEEAAPAPVRAEGEGDNAAVERMVQGVDARAQSGDLTYDDFLAMGKTFNEMGNAMPGLPGQLSAAQIQETKAKFKKHEKIVAKMTEEERTDPQIMFDDLKDTANACPRVQRIALASGVTEKEVALFVAEFEGIRESTMRIAAGEDPEEVNQSIGAPPGSSRAARRAAKKAGKKGGK